MSSKRKSFKVRLGNSHITVSPWKHPGTGAERWRYAYRPAPGQPWRYRTCRSKAEAEDEAGRKLEALAGGTNSLDELSADRRRWLEAIHRGVSPGDESRVLAFIRSLSQSADVGAAVERFSASKKSRAGEFTPHLASTIRVLDQFAGHFPGRKVSEIHLPEIEAWFATRTAGRGWKRQKDIRAALIQFFRWAKRDGIAGAEPVTVAERMPEIGGQHGDRQILDLDQFRRVAAAIAPDFRAWLVLGCFGGLRPEEIAPSSSKRTSRRGIHCEEIDWDFQVVRVAPEVSKVGFPRSIPLNPALREWLEWAGIAEGMTGPVCLTNPSQAKELARLGKLIFSGPWPKDICRHSYGSYRNAILRNLGQVAEEMGTSVAMLHRHYHNPRAQAEGEQWFALRPSVLIRSDETAPAGQSIACG